MLQKNLKENGSITQTFKVGELQYLNSFKVSIENITSPSVLFS